MAASGAAESSLRLSAVVIVSRHGVRAPTWAPERLNQYSAEPWPDFGAPPGNLTDRGRLLMTRFGAYYGEWLRSEGLLKERGCDATSHVFVWADTDQRTLETARAVAGSLVPGCTVPVQSAGGGDDPLFDPIAAGLVKVDPERARRAAEARLRGTPQAAIDAHRQAFETLDDILTGGGRAVQRVYDGKSPGTLGASERGVEWTGPFATGSTLSENLLLEYANGMEGRQLGWGRLTPERLRQALEIHAVYADVARRSPYVAQARGSNLFAHVVATLTQAAGERPTGPALGHPGDTVTFLAGHDTNLSNLSGMLGLSWHLPGYVPDDTPPGGALVFSLWRDTRSGDFRVRLAYTAQTLEQMHTAAALTLANGPAVQYLSIPGCDAKPPAYDCAWPAFKQVAAHAIDTAFTAR